MYVNQDFWIRTIQLRSRRLLIYVLCLSFFCIIGNLEMARWTTTSWCKEAASPFCPVWKPVFWWVNLHFRLFYPGPPTFYPSTINQFKHKIIPMYCVSLLPHILIITIYYILLYIKLLLLYYTLYTSNGQCACARTYYSHRSLRF